jgi:hypothetical protein
MKAKSEAYTALQDLIKDAGIPAQMHTKWSKRNDARKLEKICHIMNQESK